MQGGLFPNVRARLIGEPQVPKLAQCSAQTDQGATALSRRDFARPVRRKCRLIKACSRSDRPSAQQHSNQCWHSIFEKLSDPPGCEATIQASTALKGGPRVVDQKS